MVVGNFASKITRNSNVPTPISSHGVNTGGSLGQQSSDRNTHYFDSIRPGYVSPGKKDMRHTVRLKNETFGNTDDVYGIPEEEGDDTRNQTQLLDELVQAGAHRISTEEKVKIVGKQKVKEIIYSSYDKQGNFIKKVSNIVIV